MSSTTKILAAFANPRSTSSLRLGEEDKVIREAIRRSKHRDHLALTVTHATTIADLQRALLDDDYRIVHISGHGTGSGLALESQTGVVQVVPQEALSDLLAEYVAPRGVLECVVLSACYSVSTGRFAALRVPYTIAMAGAISDAAAIEFARGFYDAVGAGKDFETAYRQGDIARRMSLPEHQFVAHFLRDGQTSEATEEEPAGAVEEHPSSEKLLLGFALDLSGSMTSSIRNDRQGSVTRLSSFRESLKALADDTRTALREIQQQSESNDSNVDVFVHGFGLRHQEVQTADLLTLLRLSDELVSDDEIERLKEHHKREVEREYRRKASQYSGLASLARNYGFGGAVRQAEAAARSHAADEVRRRVMTDVASRVSAKLSDIGDTTVSIGALADLWEESDASFSRLDEFIYGATPMARAMKEMDRRFERELRRRTDVTPLLFVLSDGVPTDGDPTQHFEALKARGVTIVSCFVTSEDIADPKTLYGEPLATWSSGASLMFTASSPLEEDSEMARFLLRKGWSLHPRARLFIQVNHTEVLDEFLRVLVAPLQQTRPGWQLPVGD